MKSVLLHIHMDDEMARVMYAGQEVFLGNFWDFHPGCYGTKFTIGHKKITIQDFTGYHDFACKLATLLHTNVRTRIYKHPFWE